MAIAVEVLENQKRQTSASLDFANSQRDSKVAEIIDVDSRGIVYAAFIASIDARIAAIAGLPTYSGSEKAAAVALLTKRRNEAVRMIDADPTATKERLTSERTAKSARVTFLEGQVADLTAAIAELD